MRYIRRPIRFLAVALLLAAFLCVPAMAASGDVAGAVEQTWQDAATQIKTVVDNVVFPALTMVLAVAFFVKVGLSYFEYGYYVMVDHGNGMVTLYAHNSKLLVQAGDAVEAGDILSLSGSTGRSTGPHLHFEVRINGQRVNPRSYLPT